MQLQKLPSIWTDSSVTISFPSPSTSLDRSKRFEYNSIYYKDNPYKSKRKVDQFMFPHDLLINFRKSIRQATKSRSKQGRKLHKKSSNEGEFISTQALRFKADQITNKLYQKPTSLAGSYDIFGNRCTFQEKEIVDKHRLPQDQLNPHFFRTNSHEKIYITAAQRLDLSKPNNFNPGPGAYLKTNFHPFKKRLNISLHSQQGYLKRKRHEKILKTLDLDNSMTSS